LVIAQSNYLGLSWFQSEQVTGQYFFGYTLAVQAVFMLSAGLSAVLMPAFAHVESVERRRVMFTSCCRQLLLLTPILCVMQTLAFAPFVRLCFGVEKWSLAITLGVILSAGTIFRVVSFPSQALFVAEGRVRLYALWMLSWAAVFVAVVLLASGLGSALTVAIAVMVFFAIFDPMTGAMAFRLHGGSLWSGVRTVAKMHAVPVLAAVLSGLVVWLLQRQVAGLVESDRLGWGLQLMMLLAAPVVYVPLIWLLSRQDFREAKDTLQRLVIGRIMSKVRPRADESAGVVS
jgi:O-antigen/teichoic acid export membrane protein